MMESLQSGQPDTGKRYPDEVKEIAYQLWAFAAGRNGAEVARLLGTPEWGSLDVRRETVAYWAKHEGWAERATKDVQSIAPDLRHQAFSELLFAGLDGARYIRRVNAGQEEPNKVRAMLAVAAVDRIGFSPVGKGMPAIEAPREIEELDARSFVGMPTDELMRLEEQYRGRRR